MSSAEQIPTIEPSLETELRKLASSWHQELQTLLPGLPDDVEIEFDNNYLVPDFATGGATWSPNLVKLAYDPQFNAPEAEKITELRATYFHESYHVFRSYSYETTPADQSAVGIAIEEGLATKFEALFAGSSPGYAELEDRDTMLAWVEEVRALPKGFDYDWQKYKFFDAETG
ncbi:MAG: hypothetical protein JWP13_265, partial [Candidatus Saccharibacteria bacterium]|nr:hypothetical protein [Candidatus Saccharibacteria bacterium]